MKLLSAFLLFALCCSFKGFGQNGGVKEITAPVYTAALAATAPVALAGATTQPIENSINKGIDFGVSVGFNSVFANLYEARISPLDAKLKITGVPKVAFLLSTGVSVPLSGYHCRLGGRYYRKLNSDGTESRTAYYVPYGFCALATINLVTFNSAATGSAYNQKLDGGLGLGYRINDNMQLACTFEMISYRLPRQYLLDEYRDKTLTDAAGKTVTSISADDDNYFASRYLPSVSIKFFYLFAYKPVTQ